MRYPYTKKYMRVTCKILFNFGRKFGGMTQLQRFYKVENPIAKEKSPNCDPMIR